MGQVTESDYREAQEGDAKIRQEFLDAIDLERAKDFVGKVIYNPKSKNHMEAPFTTRYRFFLPLYRHLTFESERHIVIGPKAFNNLEFNLFISGLVRHEGLHAEQFTRREEIVKKIVHQMRISISPDAFKAVAEIPAYANQEIGSSEFASQDQDFLRKHSSFYHMDFLRGCGRNYLRYLLNTILVGSEGDDIVRKKYNL